MLAPLDMGTMLLVGALICLPLAGLMLYHSLARKTYPGFHLWTAGVLCLGVGGILVALRQVLPAGVSIVLGNVLIGAMSLFLARGMAVFLGAGRHHPVADVIAFATLAGALALGTYVHPSLSLRIIALSAFQVFFFTQTLHLVRTRFTPVMGKSNGFLTLSILFTLLVVGARLVLTLLLPLHQVRFLVDARLEQSGTVLLTILGLVAIVTALLTVNAHRLENDLQAAMDRVENLADRDGLTDIFNRRFFDRELDREFRRMQRTGQPLSLLMIDIDEFKHFNDTYGHQAGDDCLRTVARILREAGRRAGDMAARYGGDEFIMLLPDTGQAGARGIAEAAASTLNALSIPHASSSVAGIVTLSIGAATMVPDETASPDRLVARADQALYASKKAGRNRISCLA